MHPNIKTKRQGTRTLIHFSVVPFRERPFHHWPGNPPHILGTRSRNSKCIANYQGIRERFVRVYLFSTEH